MTLVPLHLQSGKAAVQLYDVPTGVCVGVRCEGGRSSNFLVRCAARFPFSDLAFKNSHSFSDLSSRIYIHFLTFRQSESLKKKKKLFHSKIKTAQKKKSYSWASHIRRVPPPFLKCDKFKYSCNIRVHVILIPYLIRNI